MNGKTHEAVGIASVMVAMHGASTREIVAGCLVASFASIVPDVDLIDNHKGAGILMLVEVVKQSLVPIGLCLVYGSERELIIAWLVAMVFLVVQPHRGFSHSIWCMLATAFLFESMTEEKLAVPYCIAYASHILLDVMNTKKVSIWYPYGFCTGWCKAGGVVDWLIGAFASLVILVGIGSFVQNVDVVELIISKVVG